MQGGDISDRLPPRWLFVFEGVVARVQPAQAADFRAAMRRGRWKAAVRCFTMEEHVSKVLWDLYWRLDFRFDVVTFLGDDFAEALEPMLSRESLPFGNVRSWQPDELAKRLAFMPDVKYVVHGDATHHLTYGNRGLLVTDPDRLRLT